MNSEEVAVKHNFDVLFYSNPQPMWIFDVDTLQILEINNAACERYGYTRKEFLAKTIQDLRPVEDIPLLHNILHSIRGNNTNHVEFRHLAKDGSLLHVEIISFVTVYEGRQARIVYACNVDEKRELAGKLKLTQSRLLQILETTVIGFLQIDFNWNITYWNKAAEDLIGYTREQVLERNIWEVLPEILHSDFYRRFHESMEERKNVDFSDYFWPAQKWLAYNAYPSEDGLIIHFRDITHKRLTRESLLEKIDQLKEISYLNSHALRKPVASLLGLTQLLTQQLANPNEFKNIAALINECSLELDEVVIEINRRVSDEDYLQPLNMVIELFNFGSFLSEVVERVQPLYPNHKLQITDVQQLDFYGNKQSIQLALRYLIDNAVKFSPNAHSVHIKTEVIDQNIVLSIKDFGIGMDEAQLHRLFTHINQKKHVNIGSGLPKINEVCRSHNGNMWIESRLGQGTEFSLRFPLSNLGEFKATGKTNFKVYHNPVVHIEYNAQHDYLLVNWSGFHNQYTVRDGCVRLLNIMQAHQCHRVLNNNSTVLGGWMEVCDWLIEEFFPAAQQAGLHCLAWVNSPSTFSKLSAIYTLSKTSADFKAQAFNDVESAHQWLIN
jgi:PAS domain S-box-containing protein